ncbi:acyl-CoA thioesterase domain-containing protein [Nocardia vermiculata]|uniref:Thioesterase family protein n=1 Tax=Nocardia vermiculata TaxID=257274 RepID=A0A846XYM3_9NOCA|nr:acyl-CoA thioesterase domain-containing protein [Nocardia vermiculata]NKY50900.1 thioesterase family protein [Nocardia vermiculata]
MVAFFSREDAGFVAGDFAVSRWSDQQVAGPAVCGLLARELETHSPGAGFIPARLTVDLFRPVLTEPITVHSTVVRTGTRVRVADAWITQHDEVRVRASVMYLAAAEQPPGLVWQADAPLPVPEVRLDAPTGQPPLFKCGEQDWTGDFAAAQNGERKSMWQNLPPLVEGEPISGFQRAAFLGDTTNLVCNWGTEGVGFINSDVTLTLTRLPLGPEVGLHAQDHISADGIAVGTATLYDRTGRIGTSVVTGLANARRQVDMADTALP